MLLVPWLRLAGLRSENADHTIVKCRMTCDAERERQQLQNTRAAALIVVKNKMLLS